jgi:S-layer protein
MTLTPTNDAATEAPESYTVVGTIDGEEITLEGEVRDPSTVGGLGQTFTLTTGIDTIPGLIGSAGSTGTDGDDTIVALVDNGVPANSTLNALDQINAGLGTDSMTLNSVGNLAAIPAGVTIQSVETMNVRSSGTTTLDTTGVNGLTTLNSTLTTGAAALTAATTTDINVSGATGDITTEGGQNITVTDTTAGNNITIGATTVNNGTVTVTDTDQAAGTIDVDGGTDVTITASSDATSGAITVGANTAATGAVSVTQNVDSDASGAVTAGDVDVTGGTSIDITANLTTTSEATADITVITAGTYTATAGDTTSEVTITQNAVANDFPGEDPTTAAKAEVTEITFGALAAGEKVAVSEGALTALDTDLTFTASKALTAEEVAAAFASLTDGDTQAPGGVVANGIFTGSLDAGWTSGLADGDTVTFTNDTAGVATDLVVTTRNAGDTDVATNDADFDVNVVIAGAAAVGGSAANDISAVYGAVVVDDNGTASIATITLDGFDGATLGAGGSLDALTTLILSNGAGATALTSTVTSLDLTLDGMAAASSIDISTAAAVATLNLTATGTASDVDFTAADATTVNITADANLDVSGGTFVAATDIDITSAGDVVLGDVAAAATDITASTATGDISATVDNSTNVATGAGDDVVTVKAGATNDIDGIVDLGAGDDTLVLDDNDTAVPTGTVAGGEGTDTISMTLASAAGYDGNTNFATAIAGFERLTISDAPDMDGAAVTLDMEALGFNYVTTSGATDNGVAAVTQEDLTLNNLANDGTVVLTASQTGSDIVVGVKDAATGTDDSLNIVATAEDTLDVGTLIADDVETFAITATDIDADGNQDGAVTLTASGDSVTSITVDGDADLALTTDSTVLADLDASALTGDLTYTTVADTAITVTGGSGDDDLTASGSQDILYGGDGDDTLTGANLTELWGGAGADTFVLNTPANVNSYSTIMDIESGDVIQFTAGDTFVASAIELADTAVFQDYANATINQLVLDGDDVAWFQFNDNTFIIQNGAGDAVDDFINGEDSIIKIAGVVDLSTASYNMTNGTLEIA